MGRGHLGVITGPTSRITFRSRLAALGFDSYRRYLGSAHWREVKERYRASDRPQECYCCGDPDKVHLHHKTYARIGAELLDDLVPLCRRCHSLVHVLERRGDIGLDLAGLLDEVRAEQYAAARAAAVKRRQHEYVEVREDHASRQLAKSYVGRLRRAVAHRDPIALEELAVDIRQLAERIEQAA